MNTKKRGLAVILSTILLIAMMAVPVSAAETNYGSTRAAGSVETTKIKKVIKIQNDCNIPAVDFSFIASAGTAVQAGKGTLAVLAGPNPDSIKFTSDSNTATFGKGSVAFAAQAKSNTPSDNVTIVENYPDTDHYLAIKEMTLDFSEVIFTEPGVYRYIITEQSNDNAAVQNDAESTRTLDVYVEDASTSTDKVLKIAGYVLYKGTVTDGPSADATSATVTPSSDKLEDGTTVKSVNGKEVSGVEKSVGFQNQYPSTSLTFGKEVKGNQGSKDKYFKFKLEIESAPVGSILQVSLANADESITKNPNAATTCITADVTQPKSITIDSDGKATADFYLQDGQYITVYGFITGMEYTVTEEAEGYTSTEGIEQADSSFDKDNDGTNDELKGTAAGSFSDNTTAIYTGFTNTKEGIIPTGVLLSATPWIILGLVLIAGIIFFAVRSRKKYDEE